MGKKLQEIATPKKEKKTKSSTSRKISRPLDKKTLICIKFNFKEFLINRIRMFDKSSYNTFRDLVRVALKANLIKPANTTWTHVSDFAKSAVKVQAAAQMKCVNNFEDHWIVAFATQRTITRARRHITEKVNVRLSINHQRVSNGDGDEDDE